MSEEKKTPTPQVKNEAKEESKRKELTKNSEPTAENEIRVAAKGQIKNYLGYAFRILNKTNHKSLKISATGNAIVKANILIELVKRRVGDLHQLNKIYSRVITSFEEKLGEKVETQRRVTAMDTLLSKEPLDKNDPGYQEPVPKDEQSSQSKSVGPGKQSQKRDDKRRRGPRLYNPPMKGDEKKKDKRQSESKDATKDEKKPTSDGKDRKVSKSRKEKINAPTVRDDEGAKKKDRRNRNRTRGGMMGGQDMYPRPMMNDGRHMQYNMPMDPRGFDPRRNPRQMPPYMGYPGPRSYDDFNVRPMRGAKGQRRHPPQQMDMYRRGPNDGMYMGYGPMGYDQGPYDQYGYYDRHGGPNQRYPPQGGRDEGMRNRNMPQRREGNYNDDRFESGPQGPYRGDHPDRPPMRGGPGGERGGRPGGPNPDQREPRGPDRRDKDDHRMGEPGDKRGDPREMRPHPRGPSGYNYDPEEGRSRFNPPPEGGFPMRGARGMRGSRGGGRPPMDRGEGMHNPTRRPDDGHPRKMGPPDKMDRAERPDRQEMRDRGHGKPEERENERRERGGRHHDRGDDTKNHKIVQKSRGGRGGAQNVDDHN